MDVSKLSESDLQALAGGDMSKLSDDGLRFLAGEQAPVSKSNALMQGLGNAVAGMARGAGSIGSTLLYPIDKATDLIKGDRGPTLSGLINGQQPLSRNEERRQQMDDALRTMGAEPDSFMYGAGKLGGELAGTAGVGGLAANAIGRGVPSVARAAPALMDAIRSGGMSAAGQTGAKALATRVAGGAASGALSAGMANPNDAGTGAVIGGALPVAGKLIGGAGELTKKILGGTTGVGDEAMAQAFRAGSIGGQAAADFTGAMRGTSNMDDVLGMAKQNLDAMGRQKQIAYRQGMQGIKSDKSILNLGNVDKAVGDAMDMATFKGQVKNERAANSLGLIKTEIDNWKSLDPAEFHTPEGLDALKQKIGGILEEIPFEQKTARASAGKVYDSLRKEIATQAPEYSKVMKDYSEASETIKEIERALSLGQKASADTSMRKLQSLMRNNVNTNYGQRQQLADVLQQSGGQDFMPALAGHALNDWAPRGIQRAGAATGGGALALTGNLPAAVGLTAISSPRLAGETMYGAGKISGAMNPALTQAVRGLTYRASPLLPPELKGALSSTTAPR
jgi:hypothetical protein